MAIRQQTLLRAVRTIPDEWDKRLISAVQDGYPICPRPYLKIAQQIGLLENEVIQRLSELEQAGLFSRTGVIVRHRELGFRANAMVVWDVDNRAVDGIGVHLGNLEFVTLCYQRPRRLPHWHYNLFCMIHGESRDQVRQLVEQAIKTCYLQHINHEILFVKTRFKQRGARYDFSGSKNSKSRTDVYNAKY